MIHKPADLDVRTHLLDAVQRATTSRAHFNRPRADDVPREEHLSTLPDVYVIIQEPRAHVLTHLEHARTSHTPIIAPTCVFLTIMYTRA